MANFGKNPFPRTFGGDVRPQEAERVALSRAYERYKFDTSEGSVAAAEAFAYGGAIGSIREYDERTFNNEIPARMTDMLARWEEVLRLRPGLDDLPVERRRIVEAKMRAIGRNCTRRDIEDVCVAVLGPAYVQINYVAPADVIAWMPGGPTPTTAPGPPGKEFASNRCTLAVVVDETRLGDLEFDRLTRTLIQILQALLPSWMTFRVGTGTSGFIVDVGLVDLTLI